MRDRIILKVISGPAENSQFLIGDTDELLVGRGQSSHTKINDPAMSRVHFRVAIVDRKLEIIDQGSSSGTYKNGDVIDKSTLKFGDVITAGNTRIQVVDRHASGTKTSRNPVQIGNLIGQTLGPYQLDSVIAKGNRGIVFKATDTEQARTAAVKVLLPRFTSDDGQRERFVRAMKTMIRIKDTHIVELYNAGRSGQFCWAAMEFVEGDSLAELIDRLGFDGRLDWQEVWRSCVHIARALQVGYERQIIHRNVTPTNIIRRKQDKLCKLGDFMFAKALEGTLAQQITQPGELIGDLNYMPPERTVESAEVDTRSDIYGLGATCYALLTGEPPAAGKQLVEILQNIRSGQPEPISKFQHYMDAQFDQTIMRMLAKDPDDRFPNPTVLLKELEQIGKNNGLETDFSDWWVG